MMTMPSSLITKSESSSCTLELQRQKTYVGFLLEKSSQKGDNDNLPIVELQPFTRKVWRREKSLADVDITKKIVDEETKTTSPPPTLSPSPKPSRKQKPVEVKSPQASMNIVTIGNSDVSKSRQKIHPSSDSKCVDFVPTRSSFLPGFISREDREKTTINDIDRGESPNRAYSCQPKVLSSCDVVNQKAINLHGSHLQNNMAIRQFEYLNPIDNYKKISKYSEKGPSSNSSEEVERASKSANNGSVLLPKLHPGHVSISDGFRNGNKINKINKIPKSSPGSYRIYGIKNSLQQLKEDGTPTSIEQNITFEFQFHLNKCRRSNYRDKKERLNPELVKKLGAGETNGEIMLKRALSSNRYPTTNKRRLTPPYDVAAMTETSDTVDSGIQSPLEEYGDGKSLTSSSKSKSKTVSFPDIKSKACLSPEGRNLLRSHSAVQTISSDNYVDEHGGTVGTCQHKEPHTLHTLSNGAVSYHTEENIQQDSSLSRSEREHHEAYSDYTINEV